VQLYTGLIYSGPGLIADIKRTLLRHMEETGIASLAEARGQHADIWADMPL